MEATCFALHMNWKQGILPASGGLDDQAAGYLAVITATESGINAGEQVLREKAQREAELPDRAESAQKSAPPRRRR